ncbi:MAG: AbrB/MazE/SpoVT family DNA-binding domain-containing protein [Clostridiales bacterium]|nr:AbrB/MazE/SpoVT family DNA-binding domain-containing protein [Clostridiales bacterium]
MILPKEFRRELCWRDGTKISIIKDHDQLILQKDNGPRFLAGTDRTENL